MKNLRASVIHGRSSPRPTRSLRTIQPASPDGFARNVYFDRLHGLDAAKLLPGEYYVTREDMLIVTVLGSCVAACIRDPDAGVGGMNHFMLPDADLGNPTSSSARYGVYAMEMLINELIKRGARRERFEVKVFGGGNVLPDLASSNVGHRNAEFVLRFLATEGLRVAARDLADVHPRKVYYYPLRGRVLVKRLRNQHNDTLARREADYKARLAGTSIGGAVDLF